MEARVTAQFLINILEVNLEFFQLHVRELGAHHTKAKGIEINSQRRERERKNRERGKIDKIITFLNHF